MKFFKLIDFLVRLLEFLEKLSKKVHLENTHKYLKEKKDKALESRDQRHIENSHGAGGNPSTEDHSGMFTRKRKKRD